LIAKGELIGILRVDGRGAGNHPASTDSMPWAAKSIAERSAIGFCSVRRQERLQFQATRDTLTGLYNRRFMEETIRNEERRAVRRDTSIGFMMLDVDNFKRFNDTFGHDAGDTVLRTIGKVIRKVVREEDIPCRYGGEEFVVVLPGADLQDTRQRAETLRSAVERLAVKHGGGTVAKITISVGVASFPQHGSNCQDVLKLADQALYAAKHAGRNRVAMPPAKQ